MEGLKVKICGMKERENILAVGTFHPDYLGFIFYSQSPRYVGEGFKVPEELDQTIEPVGVFVNEDVKEVMLKLNFAGIKTVQLHGTEEPQDCDLLKSLGFTVIKVFSVGEEFDFEVLEPYKKVVDYFLFDTKGEKYGGNARRFNWSVLDQYDQEVPFFLSGGLDPENILEIKDNWNLNALDFNSGVEESPGKKDVGLVEDAFKSIKKI